MVSVNFSAPSMSGCFVVFHLFGHTSHKVAPRVDFRQLRPCQKASLVNRLKSFLNFSRIVWGQRLSFFVAAGHADSGQRVFINSPPLGSLLCDRKRRSAWWTALGANTSILGEIVYYLWVSCGTSLASARPFFLMWVMPFQWILETLVSLASIM